MVEEERAVSRSGRERLKLRMARLIAAGSGGAAVLLGERSERRMWGSAWKWPWLCSRSRRRVHSGGGGGDAGGRDEKEEGEFVAATIVLTCDAHLFQGENTGKEAGEGWKRRRIRDDACRVCAWR